jgi:hypothetical protein
MHDAHCTLWHIPMLWVPSPPMLCLALAAGKSAVFSLFDKALECSKKGCGWLLPRWAWTACTLKCAHLWSVSAVLGRHYEWGALALVRHCMLSGAPPELPRGLLHVMMHAWSMLPCIMDMGYIGCSRQSYKLPSPMWDRQSPPRAHIRIWLSHRLPCDHSSLHLYHLPRFALFPAV